MFYTMRLANCIECGGPFQQKHVAHVLCGQLCARARWLRRGRRPAEPEAVRCVECGSPFIRLNPKRIYCRKTCKNRATARRHVPNGRDRQRQRLWARAHQAENNERSRVWTRKNPARASERTNRHRARLIGAEGRWTAAEWDALVALFGGRCAYCGSERPLTIDHRVPLSRGGSNEIANIVPACGFCNRSKGARTEEEFRVARMLDSELVDVGLLICAGRRSAA